jgi:hypothetical protein
MTLEALFQFALNIEEAAINTGKDSEGNARCCKDSKTKNAVPRNQGGGKGKNNHKKKEEWR